MPLFIAIFKVWRSGLSVTKTQLENMTIVVITEINVWCKLQILYKTNTFTF